MPVTHTCTRMPWTNNHFFMVNGVLKSSEQLFGTGQHASYQGQTLARNINCDYWSYVHPAVNSTTHTRVTTQTWYFAASSWTIRGVDESRIPIRITFVTEHIPFNTSDVTFTTQTFMEIVNFVANDPFYQGEFSVPRPCLLPFDPIPLPLIPPQFSLTSTMTNVNGHNTTSSLTEYVDDYNNRIRLDVYERNRSMEYYFDMKDSIEYVLDKGDPWTCRANHNPLRGFERAFGGGSRFFAATEIFEFGRRYHPLYMGPAFVRGIECDYWNLNVTEHIHVQGHVIRLHTNVDFFFSVPTWHIYSAHRHRVPIRAEVTILSNSTAHGNTVDWIDFTNFFAGNLSTDHDGREGIWHVPGSCFVAMTPISFPALPLTFDADVDISDHRSTFHFREYYDYPGDRARFEIHNEFGTLYQIFDVRNMVSYHIANNTCTILPISDNSSIIQHGYLRSVSSIFHFGSYYKYLGRAMAREIECDRWYTNFTLNGVYHDAEYFFSVEGWIIDHPGKYRIPVRSEILGFNMNAHGHPYGDPISYTFHDFIDFHAAPPNDLVYLRPTICTPVSSLDAATGIGVGALSVVSGGLIGIIIGFALGFLVFSVISRFIIKSAITYDGPVSGGAGEISNTDVGAMDEVINL